jgi:hypothetical protein
MDEEEFQVVKDDLKKASEVFHNSSVSYQGHIPNGGRFQRASGGDPQLDRIIDVSLGTIEEMHAILTQALDQHSSKLGYMANTYQTADDASQKEALNINRSIQELMGQPADAPPLNKPPSF